MIAAIIANPADDAPRLIYADWLDEHAGDVTCEPCNGHGVILPPMKMPKIHERIGKDGRTERYYINEPFKPIIHPKCSTCNGTGRVSNGYVVRAEFIRVQIELANPKNLVHGPHDFPGAGSPEFYTSDCSHDCGCWMGASRSGGAADPFGTCPKNLIPNPLLASREKELFPVATRFGIDTTRIWPIEVRRGFISQLTMSAADAIAHLPAIVREHPVERVDLSDRRPWAIDDKYCWWRFELSEREEGEIGQQSGFAPAEVVCHLAEGFGLHRRPAHPDWRWYGDGSEAAARQALSEALLSWAKARNKAVTSDYLSATPLSDEADGPELMDTVSHYRL